MVSTSILGNLFWFTNLSANSPRFPAGWHSLCFGQPAEPSVLVSNKRQDYLQALSLTGPATVQVLALGYVPSCVW